MGLGTKFAEVGAGAALLLGLSSEPVLAAPADPAGVKLEVKQTFPNMRVTDAVASNGGLNLRTAASKDGALLGKIPVGTEVSVLRVDGDWAQVRFTVGGVSKEGWAAMQLGDAVYLESTETPADRAAAFEQRLAEEQLQNELGDRRARALAGIAQGVVKKYASQTDRTDPLCDIDSISSIQSVPDGISNRAEPLTCVVGLNNAHYFVVETPVLASCLDTLNSAIERSSALTEEMREYCEWGYVQNPDARNSVFMVATCEGNSDLGKTSPDNGYAVLNWKKADPNVIDTEFNCRK